MGESDALARVLLLLALDERVHEVLLQVLVGVINAQLLEAVYREVLEAKDVEHS